MDNQSIILWMLSVLTVYRVAHIISSDQISEAFRNHFGRIAAGRNKFTFWWYLAEGLNCPYCTGVWIALAFTLMLGIEWPIPGLLWWLSVAGAQYWLTMGEAL